VSASETTILRMGFSHFFIPYILPVVIHEKPMNAILLIWFFQISFGISVLDD
jgi:hypothetical protein